MRNNIVALGLGSNLDSPITNLRQALHELKQIHELKVLKVSSIYESEAQLPENASDEWNKNYLNAVVLCELGLNQTPYELLQALQKIEIKLGRIKTEKWAPRYIDLDILTWNTEHFTQETLQIPHPHILDRPFVLLPLLEVLPEFRNQALPHWAEAWVDEKPFATIKSQKYFWPELVGVLNITTDSFSDGGSLLKAENLLQQAEKILKQGSQILDIGAESTRPLALPVTAEVELKNLYWALDIIRDLKKKYHFKISLDCRHSEVIRQVLNSHRIDFLNDVSGFSSPDMQTLLKETQLKAFVMHSLSVPADPAKIFNDEINPAQEVKTWWIKKLQELSKKGISPEQLIFDPGIGFGKSKRQNLYLLKNLEQFSEIKTAVMIGHSRKSYQTLYSTRGSSERDLETALVTQNLNLAYVQYLRVHDIESQKIALSF